MATLQARIEALATAIAAKINLVSKANRGVHGKDATLSSGSYLTQAITAQTAGTAANVADRLDLFPFIPWKNITVNELAVEVVGATVAGAQVNLGIYSSDANDAPDALIVATGTVSAAGSGTKGSAIAATTLVAGNVYWLACHSSSTASFRTTSVAHLMPIGLPAGSMANANVLRRASPAFTGGLPNPAPASTLTSNASGPVIRLKIA